VWLGSGRNDIGHVRPIPADPLGKIIERVETRHCLNFSRLNRLIGISGVSGIKESRDDRSDRQDGQHDARMLFHSFHGLNTG
jgi:hypothetical protein